MTRTKLLRRTSFRIAALFATLFSLTIIIIFTALYFIISRDLNSYVIEHVDEVRGTLAAVADSGGISELKQMVNRHVVIAQTEDDIFLLTDDKGNFVAGNIHPITVFGGWKKIPWDSLPLIGDWTPPHASKAVFGRWTDVNGGRLFIADGNGDVLKTQEILLDGLFLGLALAAASALIGALILGVSAQRRVGAMEDALDAVANGELDRRVPRSATGDDLDHVAAVINATLDRLWSLVGTLKQVSTDIAHDLKTPIGRVRHRLELIQSRGQATPDDYSAAVNDTIADIDGIIGTFEALLRIAEIEGGARKSRFEDVDLSGVLLTVFEALEPVSEDAGQMLVISIDPSRPANVRGDKDLLTQLFTNLIENAIRHCPHGTTVAINLRREGKILVASVVDDGPGIPADEQLNVFRRLYRLEKSRTTPGSGLGLSLAAAIAELHEAEIALADNKPGLRVEIRIQEHI